MIHRHRWLVISMASLLAFSAAAIEPEELAKRQARSVHLWYPQAQDSAWVYMEVEAQESSPGTYFCALGFKKGYMGMQELADGKKVVIFSVWEPDHGEVADSVPEDQRAKLLAKGDGVRTARFGGEGTGGQSFFDYDWQIGETMRFLVSAEPVGDHATVFTGRFYDNKREEWQLMTQFRTITDGIRFRGVYSFVEDFRRNYESAKARRNAHYNNGWAWSVDGEATALTQSRFTADKNPALSIDAGSLAGGFFLATGGDTQMKTTQLNDPLSRAQPEDGPPDIF